MKDSSQSEAYRMVVQSVGEFYDAVHIDDKQHAERVFAYLVSMLSAELMVAHDDIWHPNIVVKRVVDAVPVAT